MTLRNRITSVSHSIKPPAGTFSSQSKNFQPLVQTFPSKLPNFSDFPSRISQAMSGFSLLQQSFYLETHPSVLQRGFIFPTSSNATAQTIFTFHTFAYIRHNIGNSSAYSAISFILRGKHHTMHRIHHSIAYN